MAIALVKKSSLMAKLEASYGTIPGTMDQTTMFEFVDCTLDYDEEYLKSERIRNSKSQFEGTIGQETVAGDIIIELHGSGVAQDEPETDPLWQGAFGTFSTGATATTATSGNTTTLINVSSGTGYSVGDLVLVDTNSSNYECAFIHSKNTNALYVKPNLTTSAPGTRTVYNGRQYKLTINELPSLWIEYYRGDITKMQYAGCKVGSVTLDFAPGQVVRPRFSLQGQVVSAITSASNTYYSSYTPETGNMMVARYMVCKFDTGTTAYKLTAASLTINNDIQRMLDLSSAGTQNITQTGRSVTGSFSLMYEDKTFDDLFRNGTTASLMIVCSGNVGAWAPTSGKLVLGNTFAIMLPKIKYTKAGHSNDNGMWRYDMSFEAVAGGTTVGGGVEDEVFAAFL